MATNVRPDIPVYVIFLFLVIWTIVSGSPQRKFRKFKDKFEIKDIDPNQKEKIRKAVELLNAESDNIITIDEIIMIKFKSTTIPIGYGIATKLRERYGGWLHQSVRIFFTLVFTDSDSEIINSNKRLFKFVERHEKYTLFWVKNISKLYKALLKQD
jgi:hypothetical protein